MVELEQADTCCGFGGTFAVKYADISGAMLQDKVEKIRATGADYVIGCDLSCLMNITGGLEKEGSSIRALHIARLLDMAMGPV